MRAKSKGLPDSAGQRLQESALGDRCTNAKLSPAAHAKDVGRSLLRSFGTLPIDQIIPDPNQPRKHCMWWV